MDYYSYFGIFCAIAVPFFIHLLIITIFCEMKRAKSNMKMQQKKVVNHDWSSRLS